MKKNSPKTQKLHNNVNYIIAPCVCLVCFVLIAIIAFSNTYKKLLNNSIVSMKNASQLYTDKISTSLHLAQNQLVRMSQDRVLSDFITRTGTPEELIDIDRKIKWQTDIVLNTMPILETLAYYTPYGNRVTFSTPINTREDFMSDILSWMYLKKLAKNKCLFVTLPDGKLNSPYFIVPVLKKDTVEGYIVAKVSKINLASFYNRHPHATSSLVFVFDKNQNLICGDVTKDDWAEMLLRQEDFVETLKEDSKDKIKEVRFKLLDNSTRRGVVITNKEFNISLLMSVSGTSLMIQAFSSLSLMVISSLIMITLATIITIILYKRLDAPLELMAEQCLQIKNGYGTSSIRFGTFQDKSLNILADTLNETVESISAYQANLEIMAFTDPLLGVGNRSACIRNMEQLIQNDKHDFSIFMINVVDFDHFNELFSVKTGDMLLRKTSAFLDTISNSNVYRYSGDSFILIIPRADGAKCSQVMREIKDYFFNPILLPAGKYHISMNAGRADFPDHGTTAAELIRSCKIALKYAQTLSERNLCIVYNSIVDDAVGRNNRIKDLLLDAINNPSNIEVLYQPIFSVKEKKFTRLESLLRLKSTDMEISPKEVISVAEKNGLINDIGDIIIESVCSFAKRLLDKEPDITSISINLSILQLLQHGFFDRMKKKLTMSQIPLSFFEFEITETVFTTSFESVKEKLEQFRSLGIRLALDDFGAGYSGINYLTNLPIDTLKLDRQIIMKMGTNPLQDSLIKSIISSCKNANLDIVAEGIETEQAKVKTTKLGINYIQGYYFAKPMTKSRLFSFLEETRLAENKKYR